MNNVLLLHHSYVEAAHWEEDFALRKPPTAMNELLRSARSASK